MSRAPTHTQRCFPSHHVHHHGKTSSLDEVLRLVRKHQCDCILPHNDAVDAVTNAIVCKPSQEEDPIERKIAHRAARSGTRWSRISLCHKRTAAQHRIVRAELVLTSKSSLSSKSPYISVMVAWNGHGGYVL